MDNKSISSWVRQARYRAKKYSIYSQLEIEDIIEIIEELEGNCAYCSESLIEMLDHAFPLKDGAANVPANVLPCCRDCKNKKKNNDLVWMFSRKHIDKKKYIKMIREILNRKNGNLMKDHIRMATGIIEAPDDLNE